MLEITRDVSSTLASNYHRQPILTSLELFAGAGGLALGAHAAGFQHLAR